MDNKEKIPLFNNWRYWYLLVALVLVILILFFNWFTNYYS